MLWHTKCGLVFSKMLNNGENQVIWVKLDLKILELPPVAEKLCLGVGTPWVDKVYDRKSVPGFFAI